MLLRRRRLCGGGISQSVVSPDTPCDLPIIETVKEALAKAKAILAG